MVITYGLKLTADFVRIVQKQQKAVVCAKIPDLIKEFKIGK